MNTYFCVAAPARGRAPGAGPAQPRPGQGGQGQDGGQAWGPRWPPRGPWHLWEWSLQRPRQPLPASTQPEWTVPRTVSPGATAAATTTTTATAGWRGGAAAAAVQQQVRAGGVQELHRGPRWLLQQRVRGRGVQGGVRHLVLLPGQAGPGRPGQTQPWCDGQVDTVTRLLTETSVSGSGQEVCPQHAATGRGVTAKGPIDRSSHSLPWFLSSCAMLGTQLLSVNSTFQWFIWVEKFPWNSKLYFHCTFFLFTEWTNELQFYAKQGALKKVN